MSTVNGQAEENREIFDALGGFIRHVHATGQKIATDFGVAASDLIAIVKLDGAVPMKELAQRMGCDASFVTAIADTLERHGLARRESSQRDRRVKNIVLTPEGIAAKERVLSEFAARMPWSELLDDTERCCFLRLLRKMAAGAGEPERPE